jgi:hypothetical protein
MIDLPEMEKSTDDAAVEVRGESLRKLRDMSRRFTRRSIAGNRSI